MNDLQKNLDKLERIVGQLKTVLSEVHLAALRKSEKGKNREPGKVLNYPV